MQGVWRWKQGSELAASKEVRHIGVASIGGVKQWKEVSYVDLVCVASPAASTVIVQLLFQESVLVTSFSQFVGHFCLICT